MKTNLNVIKPKFVKKFRSKMQKTSDNFMNELMDKYFRLMLTLMNEKNENIYKPLDKTNLDLHQSMDKKFL